MQRVLVLLALGAVPSTALASDPTGLVYVMLLQAGLLAWPLLLPLLYLGPQQKKLRSYFLFVVFTFGVLGIVGLPQLLFTNFAAWFSAEDSANRWMVMLNIAKHVVAFAFCLWYLPRFGRLLRGAVASAT